MSVSTASGRQDTPIARAVTISLLVLVVVSPLRAYALTQVGGMNLSFFRVVLAFVAIMWALGLMPGAGSLLRNRNAQIVALLVLWFLGSLIVSSVLGPDIQNGISRALVKFLGFSVIGVFVLTVGVFPGLTRPLAALIASALLPLAGLAWQLNNFISTGRFAVLPLSNISAENTTALGTLYGDLPRLTSTFLEPNYMGMFFSAVILVCAALLAAGSVRYRWAITSVLVASVPGLVFSLSLSAFFGFLAGCLALAMALRVRLRTVGAVSILAVLLLIGGSYAVRALGADWDLLGLVVERVTTRLGDATGGGLFGRGVFFRAAWDGFVGHPLVGAGIGNLSDSSGQLVLTGHSAYLTVLGEQGLFGFIPLALLLLFVTLRLWKCARTDERVGQHLDAHISAGFFAAMVSFLVSNVGYDAMFSFDSAWVFLAMGAAVATGNPGGGIPGSRPEQEAL